MSRCPACGQQLSETDRECPNCGEQPAVVRKKGNGTVVVILLAVGGMAVMAMCMLPILIALLAHQARTAARRVQSMNNLKQIGLAEFNYESMHRTFTPGGSFGGENDTPHHSWQTMLLPFVEGQPLYGSIDQSTPWTAEPNREVFTLRVAVYQNPNVPDLIGRDGLALSHYASNIQVAGPNKALKMADFTDGLSNTIFAGEVGAGFVSWGDPTNSRDPTLGIGKAPGLFGGSFPGGGNLLLSDGAVRFVSEKVSPSVLQALSTPSAGDAVDEF